MLAVVLVEQEPGSGVVVWDLHQLRPGPLPTEDGADRRVLARILQQELEERA
jgi:hypothetical protein